MTTVTVEAEVEVEIGEALAKAQPDELREALDRKGINPDDLNPLDRIHEEVMRHSRPLEEVIDDLMRERGYTWRRFR